MKHNKIHSILTYKIRDKNGDKVSRVINRDNNSVKNMLRIVREYIKNQQKEWFFIRGTKIVSSHDALKKYDGHDILNKCHKKRDITISPKGSSILLSK